MQPFIRLFISLFLLTLHHPIQSFNIVQFLGEALAQHNYYRAQCKAEPLQRNATLDDIAQKHCGSLSSTDQFSHSGTTTVGENSYKHVPFDFEKAHGAIPVDAWFKEKFNSTDSKPEELLHSSQVVWKSTTSVGFGVCNTTDGGLIFVANYYPRGNYEGQFASNVAC